MTAMLKAAWAWLAAHAWAAWGSLVVLAVTVVYWRGREDEEDAQAEEEELRRLEIEEHLDASDAAADAERERIEAEHARAQERIAEMLKAELARDEEPGDAEASLRRAEAWRRRQR